VLPELLKESVSRLFPVVVDGLGIAALVHRDAVAFLLVVKVAGNLPEAHDKLNDLLLGKG